MQKISQRSIEIIDIKTFFISIVEFFKSLIFVTNKDYIN